MATPAGRPHQITREAAMSVLTNYVERLERSITRNLSILNGEVEEFESVCQHAVERGEATLGRQARQWYQRALARFQEIEKVEQVLHGPRYRRLTEAAPHRESTILALRARYYQTFLPVERQQRWDGGSARPTSADDRKGNEGTKSPFATPERMAGFQAMADNLAPEETLSFALIQADPLHLDTLRHAPFGPHGLVERHGARELRAVIQHPTLLPPATIEAVVYDRLLGRSSQARAVIYRLHGSDDLNTPFLSALRLNLPRVAPGTVLTLNPARVSVA